MSIDTALDEVNDAILDLQQADYSNYQRPLKKLANALNEEEIAYFAQQLRGEVDFDQFIAGSKKEGSMMGTARLNWSDDEKENLGLSIVMIEKAAEDPDWLENFGIRWFYDGNNFTASLRKFTKSVAIPLGRDLEKYIRSQENPAEDVTTNTKESDDKSDNKLAIPKKLVGTAVVVSVITAGISAFITDAGNIFASISKHYHDIIGKSSSIEGIPYIEVEIENLTENEVQFSSGGEFLLFQPGGSVYHNTGAFRVIENGSKKYDWISVGPKQKRRIKVAVLNNKFETHLFTADHTMSVFLKTKDQRSISTPAFPFDREYLEKFAIPVVLEEK